jgi:hypothetical protein
VPSGRWPAFRSVKILFGIKAAVSAAAIDVMRLPTDELVVAPRRGRGDRDARETLITIS